MTVLLNLLYTLIHQHSKKTGMTSTNSDNLCQHKVGNNERCCHVYLGEFYNILLPPDVNVSFLSNLVFRKI